MTANVWANVGGISQALPMDTLLGTPDQLLGMNAAGTAGHWKAIRFNDAANQLWNVDGTTAAPAYSFASAAGYGIYLKTANTLGFSIAGADKMLVTNTGINNAAIGATTPSTGAFTSLSLSGGLTVNGVTAINNNAGINGLTVNANGGGDIFRVAPQSAGNGVTISALATGAADYQPLIVSGNGVTIASRNGVGTVATIGVFTASNLNLTASLSITDTIQTARAGSFLGRSGATTIACLMSVVNTGGNMSVGVENSIGGASGSMTLNGTPYATVLASAVATPCEIGNNSYVVGRFTGGGNGNNLIIFTAANPNPSIDTSGGALAIRSGGGAIIFPTITTTATAANAFVDGANSNNLLRSTSSMFLKRLLGDLTVNESKNIVLNSKAIRYISRSENDDDKIERIGFTAEQIRDVDPRMITRDENNLPSWVQYPHYVVPLCVVAQDHEARLVALEAKAGIIH